MFKINVPKVGGVQLEPVQPRFALQWGIDDNGAHIARKVLVNEVTNKRMTKMQTIFATVRYTDNLVGESGYLVTRSTFEDVRVLASLDEAKLYVESLFALESG